MTKDALKTKVLAYGDWTRWFDRPFGAFMCSIFAKGQTRPYIRRAGFDAEWPAMLFQSGAWWQSERVWDAFEGELWQNLAEGASVFDAVKRCEVFHREAREQVRALLGREMKPSEKLAALYELFTYPVSFVWLAHGLERIYLKELRAEVPKYMGGDIEKNIGDISFPKKKNAHYYFTSALLSDMPIADVAEKFAWIKARGGFLPGFTGEELEAERKRLQAHPEQHEFKPVSIPKELQELARIAQELVHFRTLRTDVLYELMYLARPALSEVAQSHGLTFDELRDYSALDLIEGNVEKYAYADFSALSFGKEFALFHGAVLKEKKLGRVTELKGAIAFKGAARGPARVVMTAQEIGKVRQGDILIAPTTAPSYIIGMQRAAAFVTDEGGLTCHTAIVARELRKPCIIGTKYATEVFKDGDMVEVDAERGIVTVLERAKKS